MADPRRVQLVIALVLAGVVAVLGVRAVRAGGSSGREPAARALPALQPARAPAGTTAATGADAAPPSAGDAATPTGTASGAGSAPTTQTLLVVHVAGAVRHPGVYEVRDGGRIVDAIDLAGGPRRGADPDALNLAAKVTDGEQVVVPRRGEPLTGVAESAPGGGTAGTSGAAGAGAGASAGSAGAAAGVPGAAPIDLNAATLEQLDTLQGIGPALAQAILAYRTEHGPFTSVEDLAQVPGIGPARLEVLKGGVRVG